MIFLGGTVGNSDWRDRLIPKLQESNIAYFNPVVKNWNEEAANKEEVAKKSATFHLYYLTNPKQDGLNISGYSLVEATMALYDRQNTTVIVFDFSDVEGHTLKAMKQSYKVLKARFPNANIFLHDENWLKDFF